MATPTRSFLAVTAGSGTKLATANYTDGADSKHDEVNVLGEQFLASYVVNFSGGGAAVTTATAASHLLQIMAGASLRVRIRRIEVWQSALATAAALAQMSLVRLSSAGTGGVAQIVAVLDPSDAAAGATAMTLPTVKGGESAIICFAQPYFMQTAGASAQLNQPILVWDFDRPRSKPLIIAAGATNGIAVKMNSATAGATVWINVWLDESVY